MVGPESKILIVYLFYVTDHAQNVMLRESSNFKGALLLGKIKIPSRFENVRVDCVAAHYMLNGSSHSAALKCEDPYTANEIKLEQNWLLSFIQCANNWRDIVRAASRTILFIDILTFFVYFIEEILSRTVTVSYSWEYIASIHRFLSISVVSIYDRCANLRPREYRNIRN